LRPGYLLKKLGEELVNEKKISGDL
jgi:hypothetical protein